ncbi:AAA-domain-containing protein [Meredithblackwellia eburnea MCA 4105]
MAYYSLGLPPSPSTSSASAIMTDKTPLSPSNSNIALVPGQSTLQNNKVDSEEQKNEMSATTRAGMKRKASVGVENEHNQSHAQSQKEKQREREKEHRLEEERQDGLGSDAKNELDDDDEEQYDEKDEKSLTPLHIEVRLLSTSSLLPSLVRRMLHTHLSTTYESLIPCSEITDWREVGALGREVERVWVGECALDSPSIPLSIISLQIHIYQPTSSLSPGGVTQLFTSNSSQSEDAAPDDYGDGNDTSAASVTMLPSRELEGVWDSLIYEQGVKEGLLGYIYSTILFSDARVDFNIVSWNRVVLLHGPPGTGKTSLCRALAQKLSIRLGERYDQTYLIEINSHSLFSKWFSESGKLVQRLFAAISDLLGGEDEDEEGGGGGSFGVVLIDEVESLTAARAGAMSGKEPTDALRVVNALLTQLDKLKHRKNCLVMSTSNLSGAIDDAFVDRADIKQFIGLPPPQAVYWILASCLREIVRAGLVRPVELFEHTKVEHLLIRRSNSIVGTASGVGAGQERAARCSERLWELAKECHAAQLSGRALRRLPVLAHAKYGTGTSTRLEDWLEAMVRCVRGELVQTKMVGEA